MGKACKHAEFRRELEVEAYIWQNLVIFENAILGASLRWIQCRVERVLGCVTKALYKATSRAGETVVGKVTLKERCANTSRNDQIVIQELTAIFTRNLLQNCI